MIRRSDPIYVSTIFELGMPPITSCIAFAAAGLPQPGDIQQFMDFYMTLGSDTHPAYPETKIDEFVWLRIRVAGTHPESEDA